ncbi:hypothetical protein LHK_00106 [Laribacter hongkongensis HLHK9]|uniref:Uncharacterized protein n=1 Tax=Laribacter hongkongensis (strain HLHK9) TaxID=557598 RepID=C1D9Y9_LARHH|nr:hypothetical protein LHK_00106 [Laribacter hongkongensis HLHK9]
MKFRAASGVSCLRQNSLSVRTVGGRTIVVACLAGGSGGMAGDCADRCHTPVPGAPEVPRR